MKVIFLDFNGVLDTYEEMDIINKENLERLKKIVDLTNSYVVISSSIKNSFYYGGFYSKTYLYVVSELEKAGIKVIGITPHAKTREEEIKIYLSEHKNIENYCIIDDDYDMESMKENMVKLPSQNNINQVGLDQESTLKAIKILKRN